MAIVIKNAHNLLLGNMANPSGTVTFVPFPVSKRVSLSLINTFVLSSALSTLTSESALERTNVLIKLRETLLDTGKGTKVTVPDGLAIFPNNKLWAFLMTIAIFSLFIGLIFLIQEAEKKAKSKAAAEAQA